MSLKTGETIKRKYKKGLVEGVITSVGAKHVIVRLTKPYYGKNEDWDAGQEKVCWINCFHNKSKLT